MCKRCVQARSRRVFAPAADPLSLCRQRKWAKKATQLHGPEGSAVLREFWSRRITHFVPQGALRSNKRAESVIEGAQARLLQNSRNTAHADGSAKRPARCSGVLPLLPRREAQDLGAARLGAHRLTDSARLFERSGLQGHAESYAPAPRFEHRRVPPRTRGGGGAGSFLCFLSCRHVQTGDIGNRCARTWVTPQDCMNSAGSRKSNVAKR